MQIHVIQNGEQAGLYSPAQFEEMLQTGLLGGDDLYWHEGCDEWLPVSQHPAFARRLAVVLMPPSPPPLTRAYRRGSPSGNPAKVCWDCGHAVSPSAPMCPSCGKRLKMGCGQMFAIGIVVCVAIAGIALLGGLSLLSSILHKSESPSAAQNGSQQALAPAPSTAPLPGAETAFVSAVQSYVARYAAAPNELVKTALHTERRTTLARLIPDRRVQEWVGTLKELTTSSDGKASLTVALDGSAITVHTTIGNPFSPGSDTSVEHGSPLYNRLALLSPGQRVTFTGSFVPDDQDFLKETSLTEAGSMTEPEFAMRFSEVAAALAASAPAPRPSSTPLVAKAGAAPGSLPASALATPPTPKSPPQLGSTVISSAANVLPSPRSVVAEFYSWYLDEVRRGASPWLQGELSKRPEISHGFAVRLENAKEPEPGDDPIFSADEVPGSLEITDAKVNGFDATVAVLLGSGKTSRLVNVRLIRADEDKPWQIDDVHPVLIEASSGSTVQEASTKSITPK